MKRLFSIIAVVFLCGVVFASCGANRAGRVSPRTSDHASVPQVEKWKQLHVITDSNGYIVMMLHADPRGGGRGGFAVYYKDRMTKQYVLFLKIWNISGIDQKDPENLFVLDGKEAIGAFIDDDGKWVVGDANKLHRKEIYADRRSGRKVIGIITTMGGNSRAKRTILFE